MPAQPQDHKPKKGEPFKFTSKDGKSYTLPSATKGRAALSGRDLRDATLGGEIAQIGFLFKSLEAAKPAKAALDAVYDLSAEQATEVLSNWAEHGDGDGASLGESSA